MIDGISTFDPLMSSARHPDNHPRLRTTEALRWALDASHDPSMASADWLAMDIDPSRASAYALLTDRAVPQTAMSLLGGVQDLIPGGQKLYQDLQKSGALELAYLHLHSMRNLATVVGRMPGELTGEGSTPEEATVDAGGESLH